MKSVLIILCGILISPIIFLQTAQAAEAQIDQFCKTPEDLTERVSSGIEPSRSVTQTFQPSFSRLSSIRLYMNPVYPNAKVGVTVTDNSGNTIKTMGINLPTTGWDYYYWEPPTPLTLTPGDTYKIIVEHVSGDLGVFAMASRIPECYANGEVIGYDSSSVKDLDFATYGYNEEDVVPSTPSSPTSTETTTTSSANNTASTSPGVNASSGAAPSSKTSAAFQPPTNLSLSQKSSYATLSWVKSASTNIDGYRIFRKEASGEYKEIAVTTKDTITMDDKNVSDNIAYTYMIRSYKGNDQSVNSNEATITLTKNTTTNSVTPAKATWYKNRWLWNVLGIVLIIAGVIALWMINKKDGKK